MFRVLDETPTEYNRRNAAFGRTGFFGSIGALVFPFALYGLCWITPAAILQNVKSYVSLSLLAVFVLSIVFGVFAFRAQSWRRPVAVISAAIAALVNLFVLCVFNLV